MNIIRLQPKAHINIPQAFTYFRVALSVSCGFIVHGQSLRGFVCLCLFSCLLHGGPVFNLDGPDLNLIVVYNV